MLGINCLSFLFEDELFLFHYKRSMIESWEIIYKSTERI